MRNLTAKVKAAHPHFEVRRFLLLGCAFSLLGLRYSLRKPHSPVGLLQGRHRERSKAISP